MLPCLRLTPPISVAEVVEVEVISEDLQREAFMEISVGK